jgi:hypothetical protein
MPMRRHAAALLLLLAAACGPTGGAVPEPEAKGATPPDTARTDVPRAAAPVDAVQRRLEQARRDAESRNREALEATEPR